MAYKAPWYLRLYATFVPSSGERAIRRHRYQNDEDYREAFDLFARSRGYTAAASNLGLTSWNTSMVPRSADSETLHDVKKLRERSREAKRNDAVAAGLLRNFENDVVGIGITPQSTADGREEIEARFAAQSDYLAPAENVSWGDFQRLLYAKMLEDGEVFVHRYYAPDGTKFEVVEAERVDTPYDAPLAKGHEIRSGVERDPSGRVVAYYVAIRHPGDSVLPYVKGEEIPRVVPLTMEHYRRVPASEVHHLKLADRPGQTRGIPFLTPCLQNLRDLDLLLEATLKRAQVANCLAAFITSESDAGGLFDVTAEDFGYVLEDRIQPAMMMRLFPGEKVETLVPNSNFGDLEVFVVLLARRIGSALGVSWQLVLKDFSTANYSSARTDLLEARKVFRAHQQKLIACLRWVWRSVLEFDVVRGDLRVSPDDLLAVNFVPPGWEWVDPEKEVKAAQLELEIGLTTLRDLAASRGRDWEDLLKQQAAEKDMRESLGLDVAAEMDAGRDESDAPPIRLLEVAHG